jgi:hypothetical protein
MGRELRPMSARAPLDRITPRDFYRQIDWLRDEWNDDELQVARKLCRLRRLFEHLPTQFWQRAQVQLAVVSRARIANGVPWDQALTELGAIVSEWDNTRPPQLECSECGLIVRGHRRLLNHRLSVHGIEEAA